MKDSENGVSAAERRLSAFFGRALSPMHVDGEDGCTDLHWAAALNLPFLALRLLREGAAVDAREYADDEASTPVPLTEADDAVSATALHIAAEWASLRTVTALLDRGADVRATTSIGATSLHLAAYGNARTKFRNTPLHYAAAGPGRGRERDGNIPLSGCSVGRPRRTSGRVRRAGAGGGSAAPARPPGW